MSEYQFSGEIILPAAPSKVSVKILDTIVQVETRRLSKEQKDDLAKRWREALDSAPAQTYRHPVNSLVTS